MFDGKRLGEGIAKPNGYTHLSRLESAYRAEMVHEDPNAGGLVVAGSNPVAPTIKTGGYGFRSPLNFWEIIPNYTIFALNGSNGLRYSKPRYFPAR
jgi:hypothetical protein